jgi:LysR family hydrogen peroxide-inducible transcriptional activator
MEDIKLKDLRYLLAVADTGHFGQAAARCFVSQPTLSAQLKKLEQYLGVQLIERAPRQVALTAAGREIAQRARRIAESSAEIVELAKAHRNPLAGRLRVAFLPTIGPYLLPEAVPRLRKSLPQLELMLLEFTTQTLLERLQANDLDLGVLALPVALDGLASRKLYDEVFTVAVPSAHSLAKRRELLASDLAGETLLLLDDGHCLRDQALAVCSRVKVHEPADFRGTSIETLRQMVAAGAGITLLPERAARAPFGAVRGIAIKTFAKPQPARHIGAVWRKTSPRLTAIAAVCDQLANLGA